MNTQYGRPLRGLGIAAIVLVALTSMITVATAYTGWLVYDVATDLYNGAEGVTRGDLDTMIAPTFGVAAALMLSLIAAGVVFLVWLWRARANAELLAGPHAHAWGRGWVIGGWFCPIVNFWFPRRIVLDVWRVLQPQLPTGLINAWWAAVIVAFLADRVSTVYSNRETVEALEPAMVWGCIGAGAMAIAGVLVIQIIWRLSNARPNGES